MKGSQAVKVIDEYPRPRRAVAMMLRKVQCDVAPFAQVPAPTTTSTTSKMQAGKTTMMNPPMKAGKTKAKAKVGGMKM